MPIANYGVLACRAIGSKAEFGNDTPHYQVHAVAGDTHYRLAINVRSKSPGTPNLLFLVDDNFRHPITSRLRPLAEGFSEVAKVPGGLALDYIRGNLFDRTRMRLVEHNTPGPDNDLNEFIGHFVERAIIEEGATLYCYGQRWNPKSANEKDKVFKFVPSRGIHDTHMNQGSDPVNPQFFKTDGVWQDGGLLIHYASTNQWVSMFMAFQSQAWHTDDTTGHRIEDGITTGPGPQPHESEPDHMVRIVAALVNPVGPAPERETVTLLNTTPNPINLAGWSLSNTLKQKHALAGTLAPGATLAVTVPPEVPLSNKGGIITLLNNRSLKVDGVSYTEQQARKEGWTIVF